MKMSIILSVAAAIFLLGCKTQQKSTAYSYDDVYSNHGTHSKAESHTGLKNEDLSGSQKLAADTAAALKAASAAGAADYSTDSFDSHMQKFHEKKSAPANSDNGDYYTIHPDSVSVSGGSQPNVNLYFGSSLGYPYYGSSFSFGFGFGWGGYYGYPYWGYPYYPYYYYPYYPYYGYGYPYCGYGYYPYYGHYYDGYGSSGYYYGRRTPLTTSDGGGTNARVAPAATTGSVPSNPRTTGVGTTAATSANAKSAPGSVPPDKQRYTYSRSSSTNNAAALKTSSNSRTYQGRGTAASTGAGYSQRQAATPRYSRPVNQQSYSRANTQNYSSPSYRQPKSSQEYINPRGQQGRPSGVSESGTRSTGTFNNPSSSGRRYYSQPANPGNSRFYSNPTGGNHGYSAPSRSFSSPSHSTGGYSAPSHGGGGYSGGGHSGGGGGAGRSGGGGGGGRR